MVSMVLNTARGTVRLHQRGECGSVLGVGVGGGGRDAGGGEGLASPSSCVKDGLMVVVLMRMVTMIPQPLLLLFFWKMYFCNSVSNFRQ